MAKYDVKFSCGHTGVVEIYGSGAERERKLWWYENKAMCSDCYKAKKVSDPLVLNITLGDNETAVFYWTGNAYEVKEELKARGYEWKDEISNEKGVYVFAESQKHWVKTLKRTDKEGLMAEVAKAKEMGATIKSPFPKIQNL